MGRIVRRVSDNLTYKTGVASLKAKQELAKQQIHLPPRPDVSPTIPEELTELSDAELMKLFSKWTQWMNYTAAQLAIAEVDERFCEQVVEKYQAISLITERGALHAQATNSAEKANATTYLKAKAWEDSAYVDARDEVENAYAYRKLVKLKYDEADKNTALVSRELTRRVGRNDREGRNAKWNT